MCGLLVATARNSFLHGRAKIEFSSRLERAASAHRCDFAQFECDSAMASTVKPMSEPSSHALKASADTAEIPSGWPSQAVDRELGQEDVSALI